MTTQADRVLALLQARGSEGLTPLDALDLAGCFRLAAVVWDLRAEGWDITTTMVESPTGSRFARYHLIPPPVRQAADQLILAL